MINYKLRTTTIIRLCHVRNLIFFVVILAGSCNNNTPPQNSISIRWQNKKATGVYIPLSLIKDIPAGAVQQWVVVSLVNGDKQPVPILGNYSNDTALLFEPLIPFSPGNEYGIFVKNKKAGSFHIPAPSDSDAPVVLAVYPNADTLPQNTLKLYLQFSQPMREGQSAQYIHLVKNNTDTLPGVFLDLQPELWNEDRTVLTVWFDPGRIKRGLQPNLRLGPPLKEGEHYQVLIDKDWHSAAGLALRDNYVTAFVAGKRDSLSPDPATWNIRIPSKGTLQPIKIVIDEPLDYFLLLECLQVMHEDKSIVKGHFDVAKTGDRIQFTPAEPWQAGNFYLAVATKLEDLAGNNINRVFDRDVTQQKKVGVGEVYKRRFSVQ